MRFITEAFTAGVVDVAVNCWNAAFATASRGGSGGISFSKPKLAMWLSNALPLDGVVEAAAVVKISSASSRNGSRW